MPGLLDVELETFEKHREELLGRAEGKYVLIHQGEIICILETKADAIAQGYERLGDVPFLVKQILKVENPLNFVSSLLDV